MVNSVAVGEVDGTVDVGSKGGGSVEGGGDDGAADVKAQALLQGVARATVDGLERALQERGPVVVAHLVDFSVRVEQGGAAGRAKRVGLAPEGEGHQRSCEI